jgi:hypothetical protein
MPVFKLFSRSPHNVYFLSNPSDFLFILKVIIPVVFGNQIFISQPDLVALWCYV